MSLLMAGSGDRGRRSVTWFELIIIAVAACVVALAARASWAQSCEDYDPQCMTNGVCQPDGSCVGTALPNTTSCDDGNPCTTGDHCDGNGSCVGGGNASSSTGCNDYNDCTTGDHCDGAGNCTHTGTKNTNDSCTLPGSSLCTGTCLVSLGFAVCVPDCLSECQYCDPNTGQCTVNLCSSDPCSTGLCDEDGVCIPGNDGASCDDGNVCTTNSQCQDGDCVGTGGGTPPAGTATPTPTATPILTSCVGDCDGLGTVTVDEILTMVNIALGNLTVEACEAGDANNNGQITVDEILTAVNNALNGCPVVSPTATPQSTNTSGPTNTPTQHATPTATGQVTGTPPPTQTPAPTTPGSGTPSIAARGVGTIESTTSTFLVIPNLLSALLGHLPSLGLSSTSGTGSSFPGFPMSFSCSTGGGQVDCNQALQYPVPPPTYTVTLDNCQVAGNAGTLSFNGTLTATGQAGDVCGVISSSATFSISIPSLTVQTPITGTATFTNFTADVSLSCSGGSCDCYYDTAELQTSGTIAVAGSSTNTEVNFGSGSSIDISVYTYNAQCVPTEYDMEVNGAVTLVTNGNTFAATYDAYDIYDDATSGQDMLDIEGDVTSACFGDTVSFSTYTDIALGNPCPSDGVVDVYAYTSGTLDEITYSSSGVHIDFDDGSSADYGCLDPLLLACPG